jgi:aromatic-amino-acid transaminase
VYISDPSWENHRALFESAGFKVNTYTYYDAATHGLNFAGMKASLEAMAQGSIVVLHACCHNPTGVDLNAQQWDQVRDIVAAKGLVPFLDIAYQGFGDGPDADAGVVRRFADKMSPIFVSSSFSKSISLYGERIGALSVVASNADEAARALSQLKRVVRTNYSNPPTHGAQIVATVLTSPELHTLWDQELAAMRVRIKDMRRAFVDKLKVKAPAHEFGFVVDQRGMFSYSGITKASVAKLREQYSIYTVDSGRICVAALNNTNLDYVVDAVAAVL